MNAIISIFTGQSNAAKVFEQELAEDQAIREEEAQARRDFIDAIKLDDAFEECIAHAEAKGY